MNYVELAHVDRRRVVYVHHKEPVTLRGVVPLVATDRDDITIGMYYIDGAFYEAPPNEYYLFDESSFSWSLDTIKASRAIRERRDTLLARTDWKVLPDSPYNTEALRTYRQALRDLSLQPGFPWNGPDDPECPWPTLEVSDA